MKKLIFATLILMVLVSTQAQAQSQEQARPQAQVEPQAQVKPQAQVQAQAQKLAPTPAQPQEILAETLLRSTSSWNGAALPAYPKGTPEISILKFTIPAGATLPSHLHTVINAGILLSGSLSVVSEDQEELLLEPGDTLIELVDKYHQGRSIGDEPAVIVVFYAGIEGEAFTHIKNADSH